jgi:hypothetical protein
MAKNDATKHTSMVDTPLADFPPADVTRDGTLPAIVEDLPEKASMESPITFNPNHLPCVVTGAHVRVGMLAPTAGPAIYNSTTGRRGSN